MFVCGDPDGGGDRGTRANVEALTRAGIEALVVPRLPDNQDPDQFVQAGGIEAWKAMVGQALHSFRYRARLLGETHRPPGGWTDSAREQCIGAAFTFALTLPPGKGDELGRYFWPELASILEGDEARLRERFEAFRLGRYCWPGGDQAAASVRAAGAGQGYQPLPPYRPLPLAALPPVLSELVQASAEAIGCDPALVALPALAVAAGCIGNSRALQVKRGWSEPCVLWTLTVAPSGGHKSPAYSHAVDPLTEMQMELFDQHKEKLEEHKRDLAEWQSRPKGGRGEKPRGPDDPLVFITSDATIEALGELLQDNPRGLLLARDELDAWFQSFTRYKGRGGGTDRPQWLELHRAGALRIDRLTRERCRLAVRRAAVSVTGTIQPLVLTRALDAEALQAGLGARFLLAMPPRRKRVWTEATLPEDLAKSYRRLLQDLLGLHLEDRRRRTPKFLGLSGPAHRLWVEFFNDWGETQDAAEGEQATAFAKIEAYCLRLMLLHHVVAHKATSGDDRVAVTEASARAGIKLARWFATEAARLYTILREDEATSQTRSLVEWIASRGGRVTVRQLQKSNASRWPSSTLAEAALQGLVNAGLGPWEDGPAPAQGGHRTRWFVLLRMPSDTSDTRFDEEGVEPEGASDTRSDTCPPGRSDGSSGASPSQSGASPSGETAGSGPGRVSEVSEGVAGNGAHPAGPAAERVSEDGAGRVSDGEDDSEVF